MFSVFVKVFTMFHPPADDDTNLIRAWRQTVSWGLTILSGVTVFTMIAMTTGIPGLIDEIVWAGDIRSKVEETTKPAVTQIELLSAKVDGVEKKLDSQSAQVNAFLAQAKAAEIRAITLKRCSAATSLERDSYNREIDRLQFEYRVLRGERYDTPRCSEL